MSHLRVSSAGLLARVSGKCAMSIRLPEIAMSKPLMRLLWYLFTGPCIYQTARPWNVYQRFGRSEYLNISRIHLPTLPLFFNKCGFGLIALATFDFEPPSFGNGISCLNSFYTSDSPTIGLCSHQIWCTADRSTPLWKHTSWFASTHT